MEALIRRWVPLGAIAVVVAGLVRGQHLPPAQSDVYFHLRLGNEFLDGWSVGDPGHLGPFDSADWQATQWLPQMGLALAERVAGLTGVMWLAGMIILLVPVMLYVVCRRTTAALPAAIATVLGVLAAQPGLSARPQILSYLLVVVVTGAWLATVRDRRPRYWLILVAWAWVPLHGMWPIGILIGLVAVVGLALERDLPPPRLLRLAAIPVGSIAVSFATPLGTGAIASVIGVGSRTTYFAEWGPTDFTEPYALVLLAMYTIVLVGNLRHGQMTWPMLLLLGLGLVWGLYSVRTVPVAALMLAPFVAETIQRHVPRGGLLSRREAAALVAFLLVGAAVLAPVVASRADDPVVPAWLDERLDNVPAGTRVLNDWDTGAYFLWRHPDLSLTMHGYGDVFTDEELERNADILRLRPDWDTRVIALDVELAVVDPSTPLGYALVNDLGWTVVERDDEFALVTPVGS